MSNLRAPDGTGIKGGRTAYHTKRMLAALELAAGTVAPDFAAELAVEHAREAARAALNGMHNGRRPDRPEGGK